MKLSLRAKSLHRSLHSIHRHHSTKPLRILFLGSDDFSAASLRALRAEQLGRPGETVASITVACRPGKPTGRGLKVIRESPIKHVARSLELPVHDVDSFGGWALPSPTDLIVVVSFGLLVPASVLSSTTYGGLNVHPSLLPDFRGPAPLHHTLLARRASTGVTLQTLDPHAFDTGTVLSQRSFPVPDPSTCTVPQLGAFLAPRAADLLVQGLRERLFIPPFKAVGSTEINEGARRGQVAGKIRPEDRRVRWTSQSAEEILCRQRVLGDLWTLVTPSAETATTAKSVRLKLHGLTLCPYARPDAPPSGEGTFFLGTRDEGRTEELLVPTSDGLILRVGGVTLEGKARLDGPRATAAVAGRYVGREGGE
ncbi:MAG: Methionyl-tRNA formyltransferase [Thelocarpon impressellum]|nr:MAG: Methionyl-tRNA formyltransferase [Thelocarpon impressellum]